MDLPLPRSLSRKQRPKEPKILHIRLEFNQQAMREVTAHTERGIEYTEFRIWKRHNASTNLRMCETHWNTAAITQRPYMHLM